MRIVHTGDWHIGKIVNGISMIDDQRHILNELIKILQEQNADVLVIAGDIYDRSIPPVEAVELLNEVFSKILLELKIPILAISGNHDSGDRLSFGSELLKSSGLHIQGVYKNSIEKVTLRDEFGDMDFYLLPYASPEVVREIHKNEKIKSFDLAMEETIKAVETSIDKDSRNVLIAHAFVIGGESSESERPLSIGGSEYVETKHFERFNYTALGHLHGPQRVYRDNIRYSGSLLKYSFSECKQNKSITVVDIDGNGNIEYNLIPLTPTRDMREIKGELQNLIDEVVIKNENTEDYIHAILTDDIELMEPMSKLRAIYPNIMKLTLLPKSFKDEIAISKSESYNKKSTIELFEEFYTNISGKEFDDEKKKVIVEALKEIEKEER